MLGGFTDYLPVFRDNAVLHGVVALCLSGRNAVFHGVKLFSSGVAMTGFMRN